MIVGLANDGMQEVDGTKGTGDDGIEPPALSVYLGLGAAVREDVVVAELTEGELAVVAVGAKVLHAVQSLPQASERLAQIFVLAFAVGAARVKPAEVDASGKAVPEVAGAGCPLPRLVGNVALHAGPRINLGFYGIDWTPQKRIKLAGVEAVGVALGVVDVLFGPVAAEALLGDFKLLGGIPKGHEGEDPDLGGGQSSGDWGPGPEPLTKMRMVAPLTPFKLPTSTACE